MVFFVGANFVYGQCADTLNIFSFTLNGSLYELVKENKTWTDAAACAVERGGKLSEINNGLEQDLLYNQLVNVAGINISNTVAPDGGGASYVWIGGNDMATEGAWIWDGANTGSGDQFWQGTSTGNQVGGLFNNWGNEPDDFGTGQDGLGFAITDWPLGIKGQWNDVNDQNTLYYLIEYPSTTGLLEKSLKVDFSMHPNPSGDKLFISSPDQQKIKSISISTISGELMNTINIGGKNNHILSLSHLNEGVYFITLLFENGSSATKKFLKK